MLLSGCDRQPATGDRAAPQQPPSAPPTEEDNRPPIIVQEGSLKYTITDSKAAWVKKGTDDKKWSAKQDNAKDVLEFEMTVTGAACGPLKGTTALFDFDDTAVRRFWLLLEPEKDNKKKYEPVAESSENLKDDSPTELTGGGTGNITTVDVVGGSVSGSCTFRKDEQPVFRFTWMDRPK